MSKEQIREKLSRTDTPDIDSSDVDMAIDAPMGETAAQKRRAQQDWLDYLKQRDYADAKGNVHNAATGQFKSVNLVDDENNAYYDNLIDSKETDNRPGMGLFSLARAAAEARQRGDRAALSDIEDEIQDKLISVADEYGWDNDKTMARLDRLNSIIYNETPKKIEPLQNVSDSSDGVEPLQNVNDSSDGVEPLQNVTERIEPALEEEQVGVRKAINKLRDIRDLLWDRPGQWVGAKLVSMRALNRKEGETDDEYERRKEKRGKVAVGLGYAAVAGALVWGAYRAFNGLSSGGEGVVDVSNIPGATSGNDLPMADFHRMQDTNNIPAPDLDTYVYPTGAYVEHGSGEIQETQQVLQEVLGHQVSIHDAEAVYNKVGGDIFINDTNYLGSGGDIRIGQEGNYSFRSGFVEKAVEAYKNLSR